MARSRHRGRRKKKEKTKPFKTGSLKKPIIKRKEKIVTENKSHAKLPELGLGPVEPRIGNLPARAGWPRRPSGNLH